MANQRAPAWLERFVTSEYLLPRRNFFCVGCMQGPCSAAEFKPEQAHAGHPYLQVRKHMLRNYIVNSDDLASFLHNTDSLNPYVKNGVFTFSLRARVRERAANRCSRTCAICPEGLQSDSPGVVVCSIECLLRNSELVPIVVKDSAPTSMLPPRRRSRWDERERPRTPDAEDAQPALLKEDFVGEEDELPTASDEAAPLFVELIEISDDESERLEVDVSEEENEMLEVGLEVGAPDGITSASTEKMWTKAKESAVDATFEQNTDFNWSNAVSVWSAGTYAGFLTSILLHKDQVNLEEENEMPEVGAIGAENEIPKVQALGQENKTPEAAVVQEESEIPKVGALREESEKPEAEGSYEAEDGVTSASAEKMWNQAKKAAIDATFEEKNNCDWANVVSVWSAGTYARFLTSILSHENRGSGLA